MPRRSEARVDILHEGYVDDIGGELHVGSTVTLIIDGDAMIVVDPGMVADRAALVGTLKAHGPEQLELTNVVFSHHHPDHTVNAAPFPAARIHDHYATCHGDRWVDTDAEPDELSPSVRLLRTPGHSAEDVTTVASAADGVDACTHASWGEHGPADDPYPRDRDALRAARERILGFAAVIIPGHGPAFRSDNRTPR
ncbi:MAG TPA: MBL fold metallo-hydrolase [Streptosporangiaceae bacterium]|nr:MBL fold metallo-hydrolase [Streptosporangiaceae bacterium]